MRDQLVMYLETLTMPHVHKFQEHKMSLDCPHGNMLNYIRVLRQVWHSYRHFLRLSVAKPEVLKLSMEYQESRNIYQMKPTRKELTETVRTQKSVLKVKSYIILFVPIENLS